MLCLAPYKKILNYVVKVKDIFGQGEIYRYVSDDEEIETTEAETTEPETTVAEGPAPLEVIGLVTSSVADNTISVVWGQDGERIRSGCKYNVYVNGVKKLSEVGCNYYIISGIDAGTARVTVKAVLGGVESQGATQDVTVTGTTQQETEEVTTELPTLEVPTIETPERPTERINVVSGKIASSSSDFAGNNAADAIDGNEGTRWETPHGASDTQWLSVDLEDIYTIDTFKINWEVASAKDYQFQISMDNVNWTTVKTVTNGTQDEDRTETFAPVNARFVRVLCTTKTTIYGYSIWELEVYGW